MGTLHIISDGRHWISRQSAIVRVSSTDHRCFVHLISVEFNKYTLQHRISRLSRLPLPQLNSTVRRSTRSVDLTLDPSLNSIRLRPQTIDSIDFGVYSTLLTARLQHAAAAGNNDDMTGRRTWSSSSSEEWRMKRRWLFTLWTGRRLAVFELSSVERQFTILRGEVTPTLHHDG